MSIIKKYIRHISLILKGKKNILYALALLPISFFIVFSHPLGSRYADGSISKLFFTYGDEIYNLKTKKGDVLGAIKEAGLDLYEQDSFSIDKNTRLYGQSLNFEIKKSWPVTIFDGYKKIEGRSSTLDPREAVAQNNIEIWPEDKISDSLAVTEVTFGSVGQVIRISRAPKYKILVDDTEIIVRSWGKKISDIIKDKVVLGPRDTILPEVDAIAVPQDIVVTRINIVETTENVAIPFGTSYRDDYYTPKGNNLTLAPGSNGSKQRNLKITYKNGVEISRVITSESILQSPVNAIVKRGLMPSSSPHFKRNWWDVMVAAGSRYGVSPVALFNVAACESRVNPNSANNTYGYYGMYQYELGFWRNASQAAGFSGAHWSDGTAQIYTTARYASLYGWGRWGCKP